MGNNSSTQQLLRFTETFSPAEQGLLSQGLEDFASDIPADDFCFRLQQSITSAFRPILERTGPSAFVSDFKDVRVNESYRWVGIAFMNPISNEERKLYFENAIPLHFQTKLQPTQKGVQDYPTRYPMPSANDIRAQVEPLLLTNLKHSDVLYFLLLHSHRLKHLFKTVYHHIGEKPIKLGVLRCIAREPFDYNQLDTRRLTWREIRNQTERMLKDIQRSFDVEIRMGWSTWRISSQSPGEDKAKLFYDALSRMQTREHVSLPDCVLDAINLGAHQSGFMNEAIIPVVMYINEKWQRINKQHFGGNSSAMLPQTGVTRKIIFEVKNGKVFVTDTCTWTNLIFEQEVYREGRLIPDADCLTLQQPLQMRYEYKLSADENGELCHRIRSITLANEGALFRQISDLRRQQPRIQQEPAPNATQKRNKM